MNFKRLEIFGFKSFADKVVIDFKDGINGIVGPNGSGKSNVSEAIKWVLGEQRPSEFRCKNMQDIIFNGTERRGSMSYCEVTIVFDNSNKLFPMFDFDEVTLSRKLYRSGDSEYLINKAQCRLKDITELISSTGLGKDGYSIIGQGRINRIIQSKPEDRRSIFEDAAGISQFKSRKNEAERKLAATQVSLTNLEEVLREIERMLAPLSKQADNTKKYNEYYAQLKDLEINHYYFTYKKNKVDAVDIATRLIAVNEEAEQLKHEIESLDSEYTSRLAEIATTDATLNTLRDQQSIMMVEEERRQGNGNLFGERLTNFKNEQAKLNANIARMTAQLGEINNALATCAVTSRAAEVELVDKRTLFTQYETQYNDITSEILARETELDNSSRAIMQTLDDWSNIKADMSKLGAESGMLQEKYDETNLLIDRTRKQVEVEENNRLTVTSSLNASKDLRDKAYKNIVLYRNKVNESKLEQNKLNENIQSLSGSVSSLETKCKLLTNIREQYDGFQAPVQRLMQETKNDRKLNDSILGVVAELIKVPEKLETAIEIALGGALQNIVTATDDDAKYIIDVLKQRRMGRITILPINTFKSRDLSREYFPALKESGCLGIASQIISYDAKFNSVMSGLLGSTVICDNYDNAIRIFKKYRSGFKIVTLEGEVLSVQGSISGGSRKVDSASILSQEREIEQSTALLAKARKDYATATARLAQSISEYDDNYNNLKTTEEELNKRDMAYATETERENKISERLDQLIEELENLNAVKTKIEERLAELNIRLTSTDKLEGDIKDKRASVDGMQSKSKQLFEAKKAEKDAISAKMTTSRVELAELEARSQVFVDEINRNKTNATQLNEAILNDKSALATIAANIKQLEERINNIVASSADSEKFAALKAKINELEAYKKSINQSIIDINVKKDEKNQALMSCAEKRIKEENNQEKMNSIMDAMRLRLEEEYGLDHDKAVAMAQEDYDDSGVATQIANVKRNITKLDAVNPAAVEQYASESERYKKMAEEHDDLVKAKDDLLDIIADLSKNMLEQFNTQFAKIAENFSIAFKDVFGGGKGSLLIDPDAEDPLQAGVEIYAQPPGKKLAQISLFSGGEQALIGIAILFAILMVKPIPFSVLDEVDSALDDTNVKLFAKYLKRFRDTQFVVITHRKPTMEQVMHLFGVTMEEKGISKVLSVELNEAIKMTEVDEKAKK